MAKIKIKTKQLDTIGKIFSYIVILTQASMIPSSIGSAFSQDCVFNFFFLYPNHTQSPKVIGDLHLEEKFVKHDMKIFMLKATINAHLCLSCCFTICFDSKITVSFFSKLKGDYVQVLEIQEDYLKQGITLRASSVLCPYNYCKEGRQLISTNKYKRWFIVIM